MKVTTKKGFTLLEIIIYTALVGIVLGGLVLIMDTALIARAKNQAGLILEENMQYALERVIYRIAHASAITVPESGASNTLALAMLAPSQNPTTFTLTEGTITIAEGGNPPVALTGSHIEITNLTFNRLAGSPAVTRLRFEGRIRGASGPSQDTLTIEETVALRR